MKTKFSGSTLEAAIDRLPDGGPKMAALLDAIHQADAAGDLRWRLRFRWMYTYEATFHDDPPKAMPIAAEFSVIYDEHSEEVQRVNFGAATYMIVMERGIEPASSLPQIPLEEYEAMLAKYRDLSRRYGLGEQVYWWQMFYRWQYADLQEARKCLENAWRAPRDRISDCLACEHTRAVELYLNLGDREKADRCAEPLLKDRISPCGSTFQQLNQAYLDDALNRGDLEAALPYARELQKIGERDRGDLSFTASVLRCWGLTDTEQALALFSRRLEWTFGMWDQKYLYDFYKAAWVCFREADRKTVRLRLPEKFALYRSDGEYKAPELALWFFRQAKDIGEQFDQRNRSNYFADDLAKAMG